MLKFLNFFLIIIFSILVAGIYGIIHDQITYSISNDYFTLFKFQQFGISKSPLNIRAKVAIIGFLATWWVGLFLGIVYALLSLFRNSKKILRITLKAVSINILITMVFGILGFIYGKWFMEIENLHWYIPEKTTNIRNFIIVGCIHNFGYLGALVGLIAGIFNLKSLKI